MVWHKAGGTTAIYNDLDDIRLMVEGHELHITRNVSIVDVTYRMTMPGDFRRLITAVAKRLRRLEDKHI